MILDEIALVNAAYALSVYQGVPDLDAAKELAREAITVYLQGTEKTISEEVA